MGIRSETLANMHTLKGPSDLHEFECHSEEREC